MADTDPRVAEVLVAHHLGFPGDFLRHYPAICSCGHVLPPDVGESVEALQSQHQADMLAAAGLFTTPAHDREIAARALREAADIVKARRDEIVARHARTVGYWEGVLDALDWEELDLRATADRILFSEWS